MWYRLHGKQANPNYGILLNPKLPFLTYLLGPPSLKGMVSLKRVGILDPKPYIKWGLGSWV